MSNKSMTLLQKLVNAYNEMCNDNTMKYLITPELTVQITQLYDGDAENVNITDVQRDIIRIKEIMLDTRKVIMHIMKRLPGFNMKAVDELIQRRHNNEDVLSELITHLNTGVVFDDIMNRMSPKEKLNSELITVVHTQQESKNMEFNMNAASGIPGKIVTFLTKILVSSSLGMDLSYVRELIYMDGTDISFYYLSGSPPEVKKIDNALLDEIDERLFDLLSNLVNTYNPITVENAKRLTNAITINDNIIEHNGIKYIMKLTPNDNNHDIPVINMDECIRKVIEWLVTQQEPQTLEALHNEFRKLSYDRLTIDPRNLSKKLSEFSVDFTYSNPSIPDKEQIPVGTLIKSCLKGGGNICYYIYYGSIPSTTRDPWCRKKK